MPFQMVQQKNLPACSPTCPLNAERQSKEAVNTKFKIIGLARLEIKAEFTAAAEVDTVPTRLSELQNK